MTPVSYLISVTTFKNDVEIVLAILNTAGRGQAFHGSSNGTVSKDLWIIPNGKKNREEVIIHLQAIPAIRNVAIVALSNPVNETELAAVRELFTDFGWDASKVTDNELLLFLNDKLRGQYGYFIDFDHEKVRSKSVKIRIKPTKEHPDFSPGWFEQSNQINKEMPDRQLTIDAIEIRKN